LFIIKGDHHNWASIGKKNWGGGLKPVEKRGKEESQRSRKCVWYTTVGRYINS